MRIRSKNFEVLYFFWNSARQVNAIGEGLERHHERARRRLGSGASDVWAVGGGGTILERRQ
jgi:hypothetical protein